MKKLAWHFPLPRTNTGALIGNGTKGLLVWVKDRLCMTVGRAGFWDHRYPCSCSSAATTEESTPPDMATRILMGFGEALRGAGAAPLRH